MADLSGSRLGQAGGPGGWPGDILKGLETHEVGWVMDSLDYEAGRNVHWYMGQAREHVVSNVWLL